MIMQLLLAQPVSQLEQLSFVERTLSAYAQDLRRVNVIHPGRKATLPDVL